MTEKLSLSTQQWVLFSDQERIRLRKVKDELRRLSAMPYTQVWQFYMFYQQFMNP